MATASKAELQRKLSDQGRGLVRSGLNSSTSPSTRQAASSPPPLARADKTQRVASDERLDATAAGHGRIAAVIPSPVVAPPGTTVILCAGTSFVVETRLFSLSQLLASALPLLPEDAALHLSMDAATVKLALRLLRDLSVEPSQRTNRVFLERCARCASEFGMPDVLQQDLSHRVAASVSVIMPEVAAQLETNPRRKVLLYKQVVRKARLLDLTTGGARAAMAKQGRLKVAEALLDAAATADAQARAQYAHYAARLVDEGQNAQLPAPVAALQSDLRARLGVLAQPVKAALVPPPLFTCTYASGGGGGHSDPVMVRVNAGGQLTQSLHASELRALPCVARLLPLPAGHDTVFVGDDAERFQLALHLLRVRGRLEPGEKADLPLLASYLGIARRYALAPALVARVEAWTRAHKHGLGGARDAKEEIRGLKLTRALNPERGDTIVSSALAEAYLEQTARTTDAGKRARLLAKAEAALRTVLPVLVTSLSVTRADAEQRQAVGSLVRMLKEVLVQAGRPAEAAQVDANVRAFEQGIAASADDLARANRQRQQPVEGMYS